MSDSWALQVSSDKIKLLTCAKGCFAPARYCYAQNWARQSPTAGAREHKAPSSSRYLAVIVQRHFSENARFAELAPSAVRRHETKVIYNQQQLSSIVDRAALPT